MIKELADHGVVSEADPEGHNEMLGFKFDGKLQRWRPTARKMARCVSAGRWLLRKQLQITGAEVEVFIGHAIHILGLRTELMCLPSSCYAFIRRHYWHRTYLWPSVSKEVRHMVTLVPLSFADMCRT